MNEGNPLGILQVAIMGYPRLAGGVNTMIRTLITELDEHQRVAVLIPGSWDCRDLMRHESGRIPVYTLRLRMPYDRAHPLLGLIGWLVEFPRTLLRLHKIVREQGVQVIHLQTATSYQFYFRLLRMFGGPPYIITLRGSDVLTQPQRPWLDRLLMSWAIRGAARVVANSQGLARLAEERFPDLASPQVIYNGIRPGGVDEAQRSIEAFSAFPELPGRFMVSVGSLDPVKGHDILIRAWSLVRTRLTGIHLIIVGDGDLRPQYEQLIRDCGCQDVIHLIGELPNRQVFRIMDRAQALILPSRHEGLGNVLLEAGSLRIPVIATAVGGVPEIITTEETGLLTPAEDPSAMAAAITRLAEDDKLATRLADALATRVQTTFSAQEMTERYLDLYRQVAKR